MGILGKLFSSCIHTSIHLTEIMSFLDPLIYSEQLLFTVQQYGSKWIAVLSLKKKKGMKNKNMYNIVVKAVVSSFGPASITERTAFLKTLPHINNSSFHQTEGLREERSGTDVRS